MGHRDGCRTASLRRSQGPAYGLRPLQHGSLLATVCNDHTIRLWNTATGEVISTWPRKVTPTCVALAPDNKTLAIMPGNEAGSVAILDAGSGKELHTFTIDMPRSASRFLSRSSRAEEIRPEGAVVFSPDRRFLAVHAGQAVTLWDTATHKRVRRYDVSHTDNLRNPRGGFPFDPYGGGYVNIQFAADGQTLLAAGGAGGVLRMEIGSIEALEPFAAEDADSIAVASGGSVVAAAGRRGLTLWDGTGKRLHAMTADGAALSAVACTPDGKTVVTGDRQGRLRVWDAANGKERIRPGVRPGFRTVAATSAGTVTADEYALVRWDAAGTEKKRFKLDPAAVTDLLLSPDGGTLAVRQTSGEIQLLDTATGTPRATVEGKDRKVGAFQFSADGRWLVVMDSVATRSSRTRPATGGTASLYDARTGKEVRKLTGSASLGKEFVFLPDGRTLVTGTPGGNLCLWETLTGKLRRVLPSAAATRSYDDVLDELLGGGRFGGGFPGGAVDPDERKNTLMPQRLAAAPDGRTVAVVQRTMVTLVNLQTGKPVARLEHMGTVSCVAYSPDGRLIVTSGHDHAVNRWDGVTGKEIGTLSGHRGPVRAAAFGPDGKTLVTAAEDQTALIWDVAEAVKVARQTKRNAPTPRPLEDLWADLASNDAQTADTARREMESRPADALSLLKERLRPALKVDAKQLTQWIAELDNDDFATRERAASDLERAHEQARAALEGALKNPPSPEVKRCVTELLKKLNQGTLSADLVRDLRALEAVDKIGSPEAMKLLEAVATGAPSNLRTQDAKASLQRMKRNSR